MEQTKFTYSPFCKAFEKEIKTIEDQGIKQAEALRTAKQEELKSMEGLFTKKTINNEMRNETDDIKN